MHSLIAFNGSSHCNKENAYEFLKSYKKRKLFTIQKKRYVYETSPHKINTEKFLRDMSYIEELTEKYDEAHKFISIFLSREKINKKKMNSFWGIHPSIKKYFEEFELIRDMYPTNKKEQEVIYIKHYTDEIQKLIIFFHHEYLTKKTHRLKYKSYDQLQKELDDQNIKMEVETIKKNLRKLADSYLKIISKNNLKRVRLISGFDFHIKEESLVIILAEDVFNEYFSLVLDYFSKKGNNNETI